MACLIAASCIHSREACMERESIIRSGRVLPPATLFELRKLSRLASERVHMPDELWARIVYDFALAHRTRTINRDHLLRSLTPLYLAWVVSYAREVETAGAAMVEQRIERLAVAYE